MSSDFPDGLETQMRKCQRTWGMRFPCISDELLRPYFIELNAKIEGITRQRDELKRQLDIAIAENLEMRRANQESDNWKDDELYCFRCDRVMSACGCPLNDDGNEEEPKKTVSHPPDPA